MTRTVIRRVQATFDAKAHAFRHYAIGLVGIVLITLTASMLLGTQFPFDVAALTAINALAIMGLSILYGWSGQISLAHGAFLGLGAYTTAFLRPWTADLPGGPVLELGAVILLGILAGLLVGLPALRVTGLQLAILTVAFAEVFAWGLIFLHPITGGTQGKFVGALELGPFSTADSRFRFTVALGLAAIGGFLMIRLRSSPLGRAMTATRDSELTAVSVGIRPAHTKLLAFVISAVYAGVAGWMFAYYIFAVTPGYFTLFTNIYFLVAVILGGRGLLLGAWLGGAYLVVVPEFVRSFGSGNLYPVVSGIILVLVILLAPEGFARLPQRVLDWRRSRFTGHSGGVTALSPADAPEEHGNG